MGTGPEDLYALEQELLDASVESLDTIPTFAPALGGAPERSYISPGLPAVRLLRPADRPHPLDPGLPLLSGVLHGDERPLGHGHHRLARGDHHPLRPGEPEPAGLRLPASPTQQIAADGWALRNHLLNMIRSDELFSMCDEVFWDGLRFVNPQGGCAGWTLNLRVQLDGYEESLTPKGGSVRRSFSKELEEDREFEIGGEVFKFVYPHWKEGAELFDRERQAYLEKQKALAEDPERAPAFSFVEDTEIAIEHSPHVPRPRAGRAQALDSTGRAQDRSRPAPPDRAAGRWLVQVTSGFPTRQPQDSSSGDGSSEESSAEEES